MDEDQEDRFLDACRMIEDLSCEFDPDDDICDALIGILTAFDDAERVVQNRA